MSRFTEEDIFKYLDNQLTGEQREQFEQELHNDSELSIAVAEAQKAHQYFDQNALEKAPEKLTDQVMARINGSGKEQYYRPSGLYSSTGFLLISGILTAVVAFLSLINAGYIDWQTMVPDSVSTEIIGNNFLNNFSLSKKLITNSLLVIYGVLALVVLDRFVFNPLFRKRVKQLGYH